MASRLIARVKPYNPKRGCVVKTYVYKGVRYVEGAWHEVTEDLARELRRLRQDHDNVESAPLFDIMSTDEALRMEEERERAEEKKRLSGGSGRVRRLLEGEPEGSVAKTADDQAGAPVDTAGGGGEGDAEGDGEDGDDGSGSSEDPDAPRLKPDSPRARRQRARVVDDK